MSQPFMCIVFCFWVQMMKVIDPGWLILCLGKIVLILFCECAIVFVG